jgi:hypothetical protein
MPRATVSHEHEKFNLKSCPPDGFVVLRTLSFHEMMQRRDIASKMWSEVSQDRKKKQDQDAVKAYLEVMNVAVMEFEFKNCIVDHNLEDDQGNKLDFNNPLTFKALDPKIGAEINRYIESLTQESEEDVAPLPNAPTSSSPDGERKPTGNLSEA